jgi:hypothetical protein
MGAKRLLNLGCKLKFKKTKIRVPIEVKDYDDFNPGTRYPKMIDREIWLVMIEMPKELMNEIRDGSVDLEGQTLDLQELDDSYDEDLEQGDVKEQDTVQNQQAQQGQQQAFTQPTL